MKKLFLLTALVASTLVAQGAQWKSFSFLSPNVTSFLITNAVGATNLVSLIQAGRADSATNYIIPTAATKAFQYTNTARWFDSAQSNYWIYGNLSQTQYGVMNPGVLVVDVLSNITAAAGVFGVSPPNHTNYTMAVTNDTLNVFQDVPLDTFTPATWPGSQGSGVAGTNIIGTLSCTILSTAASQSNYVSFVLVPVVSDVPDPNGLQNNLQGVLGNTLGLEVSLNGSGASSPYTMLAPFTISFTNSPQTVPLAETYSAQIPANLVFGAKALRVRSATAGTAAASGLAGLWISNLRFNALSQ